MMKKTILFGVILSCLLLLLLPCVNAIQYKEIRETKKKYIESFITESNYFKSRDTFQLSILLSIITVLIFIFLFVELSVYVCLVLSFYLIQPFPIPIYFLQSLVLAFFGLIWLNCWAAVILIEVIIELLKSNVPENLIKNNQHSFFSTT